MSTIHRVDVHQDLVPPLWSRDLEGRGGDPSGRDSPRWSPQCQKGFKCSRLGARPPRRRIDIAWAQCKLTYMKQSK